MTILDSIKERRIKAMKDKDQLVRDVLSVVIGQVQQDGDSSDAAVVRACQKIIKSNNETISAMEENMRDDGSPAQQLRNENSLLESFLPRSWTEDEVRNLIKTKGIDVKGAASEGAAMGLITKALKETSKAPFDGKMVRELVAALRQADS